MSTELPYLSYSHSIIRPCLCGLKEEDLTKLKESIGNEIFNPHGEVVKKGDRIVERIFSVNPRTGKFHVLTVNHCEDCSS